MQTTAQHTAQLYLKAGVFHCILLLLVLKPSIIDMRIKLASESCSVFKHTYKQQNEYARVCKTRTKAMKTLFRLNCVLQGSRTCLLFLLAALTCRVRAQNTAGLTVARDQCSLVPRPVDTHPGAEAVISTLVDLSQFGDGVFGCGAPIPGASAFWCCFRPTKSTRLSRKQKQLDSTLQ